MKSVRYIFVMIGALVLLNACSPSSLDAVSYVKWVEDESNELCTSKDIDGYSFTLQYKPAAYIVLMESGGQYPGADAFQKRMNELGEMQYYTLRISSDQDHDLLKAGIHDDNEYYSRLEYFTSVMQNDLELVSGSDTIACVLYHYERNYNLSPYTSFVLAFEKPIEEKRGDARTLVFHDQVFGVGTIKLSIPEENIENMPALIEAL